MILNRNFNPQLFGAVLKGHGIRGGIKAPAVFIGCKKHGFLSGDLLDANATIDAIEKNAQPVDPLGGNLIVTLTTDTLRNTTADVTVAEILQAIEAGKNVFVRKLRDISFNQWAQFPLWVWLNNDQQKGVIFVDGLTGAAWTGNIVDGLDVWLSDNYK